MKNTNLFNFQNGMAYALATLGFDNAIPYETISYTSSYFDIDENGYITPINADLWIDPTKRTNDLTLHPASYDQSSLSSYKKTYPELIDYSRNANGYENDIIYINENNNMYSMNKGWSENRALVPLFLNNSLREYSKIVVKYTVYDLDYIAGRHFDLGVANINKETGYFTYLQASIQDGLGLGNYEISFDISQLDDIDYISLFLGTAIWEITEMRLV